MNLNPVFATYGKLYALFQVFGQVSGLKYNAGDSVAFVRMKSATEANYAFKALDGSDLWDCHLTVRFVANDKLSAADVARYEADITAKKPEPDKGQVKRKDMEEKEKEDEKNKRMKAFSASQTMSTSIDEHSLRTSMLESLNQKGAQEALPSASDDGEGSDGGDLDDGMRYDYNVIVIGGGPGGLAAAKEAAALGAKVACLDFVKPSPQGTTWAGLGGTCVNVGCIPKKIMHQAALLGQSLKDAKTYGWKFDDHGDHEWVTLLQAVKDEIGYRDFLHKGQLEEPEVIYINAFAEFTGPHSIKATNAKGRVKEMTSEHFVIATGGRPKYPGIPGIKEYCISSDDLFSLPYCPGKTLVIGASYVSLECAGFLRALGLDVTVMVRSILLRGFDQQMAELIGSYMQNEGIKFIRPCVPTKVERLRDGQPGRYKVTMMINGVKRVETFNTVLVAVGREPCTSELHLENVGVNVNSSGYVVCGDDERTSCPHVFAVGDVVEGRNQLAPVAIKAGKLLAKRLFGGATLKCDYVNVPTTVFTPLEYGCVGLSEEDATAKYGAEGIQVYHSNFMPLEWTVPHREENACYAKLICVASENEKVVGLHVLGPNAGEMTQGWTVGIKLGATKSDFDNAIGIHPTCAEVFTTLTATKRSGKDYESTGC